MNIFINYSSESNFKAARQAEMNKLFSIDFFTVVGERGNAETRLFGL